MASPNLQVRVRRKVAEAIDIASFELVSLGPDPLPRYDPGAHIDVVIGDGQTRQYSLCAPCEGDHYLIGVKRDPQSRGGSTFMHSSVSEGDVLTIGPPRNHFPIATDGERFVLLAGGIGITPLLCMATELLRSGKSVDLHYFAQSEAHVAFSERLRDGGLAASVRYHLGHAPEALADIVAAITGAPEAGKYLYLCGPRPFMELVRRTAEAWPADSVRFEYFGAGSGTAGGAAVAAAASSFEVCAVASGITCAVGPTESIVQALRANGVHVETSCEEGHCGTCMAEVVEGKPDHRDSFLTADERAAGDRILPCVSRSCSPRLVLNL